MGPLILFIVAFVLETGESARAVTFTNDGPAVQGANVTFTATTEYTGENLKYVFTGNAVPQLKQEIQSTNQTVNYSVKYCRDTYEAGQYNVHLEVKINYFDDLWWTVATADTAFNLTSYMNPVNIPREWVTMQRNCRVSMRQQIQIEVGASLQYLAMGAHFSKDTVNRPGFAKMFFEAASEEREHAMKLIEYLLMRGELTTDVTTLLQVRAPERKVWEGGLEAMEQALRMENEVTKSIRKVIKACEDDSEFNDYHLVDYLTGDFLEEQYKGQRDIAGKASTLKKLLDRHASLGEFIFDKKLLGIDV